MRRGRRGGRFSGDFLIQKRGRSWVARLGGILILLGSCAIVTAQEPIQLLIGLAAVGYGSATLVPSALGVAANIPGASQIAGVTLVNLIMRIGFFVTSPLVGLIATATNLRWGLSILLLSGTVVLVLASRLSPNENAVEPDSPDARERDGTNSPPGMGRPALGRLRH